MHCAADEELFEKAAMIRDNITILEEFLQAPFKKMLSLKPAIKILMSLAVILENKILM